MKTPDIIYVNGKNDESLAIQLAPFVRTKIANPSISVVSRIRTEPGNIAMSLWAQLGIMTSSDGSVTLPALLVHLDSLGISMEEFVRELTVMLEKMPTLTIGLVAFLTNIPQRSTTLDTNQQIGSYQFYQPHDVGSIGKKVTQQVPKVTLADLQ